MKTTLTLLVLASSLLSASEPEYKKWQRVREALYAESTRQFQEDEARAQRERIHREEAEQRERIHREQMESDKKTRKEISKPRYDYPHQCPWQSSSFQPPHMPWRTK